MKKKIYLIALTVLLMAASFSSRAATFTDDKKAYKEAAAKMTDEQKQARIAEIKTRVLEIKEMDKAGLTREEKNELKLELKSLKHEAQAIGGGGVFLSIGAILIVILVVLLLL